MINKYSRLLFSWAVHFVFVGITSISYLFGMRKDQLIFIKKDKSPIHIQIVAVLFLLLGLFLFIFYYPLYDGILFGIAMIVFGFFGLTFTSVLHFDPVSKKILTEWRLFGFKWYKPENTPEIEYIAIVPYKIKERINYKSISTIQQKRTFHVNLIFRNSPIRYRKIISCDLDFAQELALRIATSIDRAVYDNSSLSAKWIGANSGHKSE